jgi:hypothetical protein
MIEQIVEGVIMPKGEATFCEYIEQCNKTCFKKDAETCMIKRFYDKYGIDYQEEMFIGSLI